MPFLFSALMILNEKMADINVALPTTWSGLLLSSTALKKKKRKNTPLDFVVSVSRGLLI